MADMELIKQLRERTNVSLGLCKKAIEEVGTVEDAIVLLQKWGEVKSAKAAKHEANEGAVYSYTHHNGRVACLVEVNCQTEFGALSDEFKEFCDVVALQIVAMSPKYLSINDIPEQELEVRRDIFKAQVPEKVPEDRIPHVINGKMNKWFSEVCLINQKAVASEDSKTIEQLRQDLVAKISENIIIKRFVRWEVGESNV